MATKIARWLASLASENTNYGDHMGTLVDLMEKEKRNYGKKVELAIEEVVEEARFFAPRGHTDQLRSGIDSGGVVVLADEVRGFVISSAISERGYEYAGKQHDDEDLHHASPGSGKATKSFIDFSTSGNTAEARYSSGYNNHPGPFRYATKYLNKGFAAAINAVREILGAN